MAELKTVKETSGGKKKSKKTDSRKEIDMVLTFYILFFVD
jgi:hypothetical protein